MDKRIIKFRAWSGEEMVSPDYITRDGFGFWKENSIPTMSKELMQFTGLEDVDGQEIFEGDILQEVGEDNNFKWLVKWHHSGWYKWVPKNEEGVMFHIHEMFNKYRIIGNIHQNPELLNS